MEAVVTVIFVALLVTKLVDTVRNFADPADSPRIKGLWNLLAFALGVTSAFVLDAAGVQIANGTDTLAGTGLIIGATASGWHEALDALSGIAKRR